ncbi:MAG TPA: TolC family protein [Isosphaeraceae bacterium]|nr:TolC family protein [Isosphaeraceae bacterium]
MERIKRIGRVAGGILVWALVLAPTAGWAQAPQPQPPPPQPDRARGLEPLPGGRPLANPATDIIPPPPTPPSILPHELRPIDLHTALQLANVQNPELNIARQRIVEAAAQRQLAAAYFLPSINPGLNYDSHTGNLQQSNGNILAVNRSAFYVGAGANAIAAGTVSIPGVFYAGNPGFGLYAYLATKQVVRQREFETVAVRNQMFLLVTSAYSELLRAEGRRAASIQARDEAKEIARLTAAYARAGQGRVADANRAATVLATWESRIQATEAEVLTASARLCQLLNLDPSIRLHPTDAVVVPQPIVPDPIPLCELIALGLLRRPELAAQRAAIEAAFLTLGGAKVLPFSPNFWLGFSAGGFGGGSNLVRPIFGGFGGREDLDVIAFWTIQNLGLGNVALINVADARLKINQFQQVELLNLVRADIAEAYARTHARYAQIGTYEEAVRAGYLSFHEDLERTVLVGAARPRDVLPIELLNSFMLLADARLDYLDAIVNYNESQFAMYVALGQPPADMLAHPVPTEGVAPRNLPPGAPPPGRLSPLPIPATPEAGMRPVPADLAPAPAAVAPGSAAAAPAPAAPAGTAAAPPRDTVQPAGLSPSLLKPVSFGRRGDSAGQ